MDQDKKSLEDNKPSDALSVGESRRRFVKGTLAAAPVLMTVVSRPVWGDACTPSGMASGNASTPGGDVCTSNGLAPADYIAIEVTTEDPSAPTTTQDLSVTATTITQVVSTTTYQFGLNSNAPSSAIQDLSFSIVFGVLPTIENNTKQKVTTSQKKISKDTTSLKQVLISVSDETIDGFADPANFDNWTYSLYDRAAVTAYFNAVNGWTPNLSTEMIVSMVYGAKNGGYQAAPGVIWYEADVLAYFMFTWGEGPLV